MKLFSLQVWPMNTIQTFIRMWILILFGMFFWCFLKLLFGRFSLLVSLAHFSVHPQKITQIANIWLLTINLIYAQQSAWAHNKIFLGELPTITHDQLTDLLEIQISAKITTTYYLHNSSTYLITNTTSFSFFLIQTQTYTTMHNWLYVMYKPIHKYTYKHIVYLL